MTLCSVPKNPLNADVTAFPTFLPTLVRALAVTLPAAVSKPSLPTLCFHESGTSLEFIFIGFPSLSYIGVPSGLNAYKIPESSIAFHSTPLSSMILVLDVPNNPLNILDPALVNALPTTLPAFTPALYIDLPTLVSIPSLPVVNAHSLGTSLASICTYSPLSSNNGFPSGLYAYAVLPTIFHSTPFGSMYLCLVVPNNALPTLIPAFPIA